MSYTLKGRIESRLAALLLVLVAAVPLALVEHRWWPVEAAALMLGIGLALDVQLYYRLLPLSLPVRWLQFRFAESWVVVISCHARSDRPV